MTPLRIGQTIAVGVIVWCVLVWVGIAIVSAAMPPSFPLVCTMPEDLG